MSQNPTQNNLPQIRPSNAGNFAGQRPLSNNSNAKYGVYISNISGGHRIIDTSQSQSPPMRQNLNLSTSGYPIQSTVNNSNNQPANNPMVQAGQQRPPVNHPILQNATASTNIANQGVASSNTTTQSGQPILNRSMWEEARNKKGYETKNLVPRGTPRKLTPSKKPMFKKPVQPPIEKKLVKEFVITGSMVNAIKKINLMRLHRGNNVLDKFQPPVKLHRRDPEAPSPGAGNARQNEAAAAAAAAAAAVASTSKTTQQQGPTTGADTSKIAPFAGARHNKKNLFKKRTTQIYLADDRQRQLKAEERLPWVLEDYDGTHTWVGHFEETDAKYGFLIMDKNDDNKLRFLPSHRWYAFRPQIKYKTLTIEEAEEEMARAKKRDNDRWMMRRWGKQNEKEKKLAEEEGGILELKSTTTMKTVENEEDLFGSDDDGNFRRPRRGIESEEEMEYEQVFEDDEEELPEDANPIDEENAEVVKLKKRAIHKPSSLEGEDEDENSYKLTQEGMQLKKLVRKFDDNEVYDDSDQESNPYASEIEESEEESNSESPARTPIIGAAGAKPAPAVKTDKNKSPAKPKTAAKPTGKAKVSAISKPKATIEKPKGKATAASKTKSTFTKSVTQSKVKSANLSASEEAPLKPKLKSSDKPGVTQISGSMSPKPQTKSMAAIPVSSSPEDSAKKQFSKLSRNNLKGTLPMSAKATANPSQIAKKQKSSAVRQPTPDMPTSLGKRSAAYDVSDDDRPIPTLKRVRQNETSTNTNRSTSLNVSSSVRTTTGDIKRVRDVKEPMPITGKKVRTEKPISGSQAAAQGAALSSSSRADSYRLITEREVRQIISKNSDLTVPTIIRAFRKRIQEDIRNRDLLLGITKNVAVLKDGHLVLKDKWDGGRG